MEAGCGRHMQHLICVRHGVFLLASSWSSLEAFVVRYMIGTMLHSSVFDSRPDLDLYRRVYEGPASGHICSAAQAVMHARQLCYGSSCAQALPCYDSTTADSGTSLAMTGRIAYAQPACEEPDGIESVQHVLLHCPVYQRRRAILRAALAALPAAQAFPAALTDDEGVAAFLRDDFMAGALAALIAADSFLHMVITLEHLRGAVFIVGPTFYSSLHLNIFALHAWIACA